MFIKRISFKEGVFQSSDTLSKGHNLIFSSTNTKGKTTFLRLLFYALGYPIPALKGTKFSDIETKVELTENGREYVVERSGELLFVQTGPEKLIFTLPSEHEAFLSYVFQYDNIRVLSNLLGFMYIDQEKGWTLLNRGTVIGKVKFSIEELLAGLNNIDIGPLLEKRQVLDYDKRKYKALIDLQELGKQVYEQHGEVLVADINEELEDKINYISLKIRNTKESLKEINKVIRDEKQFFNYIDSMRLYVRGVNEEVPVSRKTLVNAPESMNFLKARQSVLATNIEKLEREKDSLELQLTENMAKNAQVSFIEGEGNTSNVIDRRIASFSSIDQTAVNGLYEQAREEYRIVGANIKSIVQKDNLYITKIYRRVLQYVKRLELDEELVQKEDYIFTKDLKSMSGAVLQKMVFAFKLAFLKTVEEAIGTKLFMVIDSPRGKELDDYNTKLIMDLIKEELAENQVIIASIYDFICDKKIVINTRAIEARE